MKIVTTLALVLSSTMAFAVTPAKMAGQFTETFEVPVGMYVDEASCVADGGKWLEEYCSMPASNDVEVTYKNGKHELSVSTIGVNLHMCNFDGPAKRVGSRTLKASQKADYWNGKDWVPGVCEVTVKYANDKTVAVSSNGKCQSFCGANAYLEIEKANRK